MLLLPRSAFAPSSRPWKCSRRATLPTPAGAKTRSNSSCAPPGSSDAASHAVLLPSGLEPASEQSYGGPGAPGGSNRTALGSAHDPGRQQRLQSNGEIFACQHMADLMLGLRHKSKPCDDTKQCLIIKSAPDSRAHLFQIKGITAVFTGLKQTVPYLCGAVPARAAFHPEFPHSPDSGSRGSRASPSFSHTFCSSKQDAGPKNTLKSHTSCWPTFTVFERFRMVWGLVFLTQRTDIIN